MAIPITVPRLGWTMDEGVFAGWLKQDGDLVQAGEPLFALESEKATQDIEAIDGGVLRIPPDAPKPGDVVAVGAVLAYLLEPGAVLPDQAREGGRAHDRASAAGVESLGSTFGAHAPSVSATREGGPEIAIRRAPTGPISAPTISPRALRLARELGIDWTQIRGTGSSGRIRERDVRANLDVRQTPDFTLPLGESRGATPTAARIVPLSPIRKTIAARMRAGIQQPAPVTLTTECDVTSLVQFRRQLQLAAESADGDRRSDSLVQTSARDSVPRAAVPTYADFIIKLTAAALEEHPMIMAQWTDHGLALPDGIHINVAIDTEGGLVAPLIRDVPRLRLHEIAAATRRLIELASARRLTADQLASGTFTISNLGMYGIDAFTPILNAPQSAILGVGRIRRMPAVVQDAIVPRDHITLSLTFDHRVIDGAPAARFLNTLRNLLEGDGGTSAFLKDSLFQE